MQLAPMWCEDKVPLCRDSLCGRQAETVASLVRGSRVETGLIEWRGSANVRWVLAALSSRYQRYGTNR